MLKHYHIDRDVPIPMHYQLRRIILEEIKKGTYAEGDMLPTEMELGEIFGLSRTTVRRAIADLTNSGYLYSIQGKGTFVAGGNEIV